MAAVHGAGYMAWDVNEFLLASIADLLAGANWQRSGKGQRPKPIERPKSEVQLRKDRGLLARGV